MLEKIPHFKKPAQAMEKAIEKRSELGKLSFTVNWHSKFCESKSVKIVFCITETFINK